MLEIICGVCKTKIIIRENSLYLASNSTGVDDIIIVRCCTCLSSNILKLRYYFSNAN